MKRTELTKRTAQYKGYLAMGSATVTALLVFLFSWYFLILGVPLTGYYTFRWLQYRAKWGLRF